MEEEFILKIKEYISSKLKNKEPSDTKKNSETIPTEISAHIYAEWIDKAAKNAESICIATHPAKFTNSEIKTENVKAIAVDFLVKENFNKSKNSSYFVNTINTSGLHLDLYCNAAYLAYAGFLLLKNPRNNMHLINEILSDNTNFLQAFSKNKDQVTEWINSFKAAVKEKNQASHYLAKQIYFPISKNEYHIVSPLTASSLYHKIYEKINYARYSENSKKLREKKKNLEYSEEKILEFPNLAEIKFGGTKPQNISYLNSLRAGKILLLNCKPPQWNKNKSIKLINLKNFWPEFEFIANKKIRALKLFLLNEKRNNYEIREEREEYVNDIIESFIFYLIEIKKGASKYKLDENLTDSYLNVFFQINKNSFNSLEIDNFIKRISNEFTSLLIKRLKSTYLSFSNDEYFELNKLIKNEISDLIKNQ